MTKPIVRLTPSRTLAGTSKLAQEAQRQGLAELQRRMEAIGADAVERINTLVAAKVITDRAPDRRHPGRHLAGSFRYRVIFGPKGGFPVRLEVYSLANKEKVNALESGARRHPIVAKPGGWLEFPKTSVRHSVVNGQTVFTGKDRGSKSAYGSKPTVRAKKVDHPGNRKYAFMRRGLDQAIRAAFGSAGARR